MLRTLHRLRQEDPDSFAGIVISPDNTIELLVTASTPATVRAIDDARSSAVRVRVVEGMKHSHADLESLRDEVLRRHADLKSRGVHITEFGVDERANKVRIGVKDLTPDSAELLAREFGADKIDIVQGREWAPVART
jgi:hypothetical protein